MAVQESPACNPPPNHKGWWALRKTRTVPPSHLLSTLVGGEPQSALLWAGLWAVAAAGAATMRWSLLQHSPERVLHGIKSAPGQVRMEAWLASAKPLSSGARWLQILFQALCLILLFPRVFPEGAPTPSEFVPSLLWIVPSWMGLWTLLPRSLAMAQGDAILRLALVPFATLLWPLLWAMRWTDALAGALVRIFQSPDTRPEQGQVLRHLRSALKDQGQNDHIDETAQELIRNVLDFWAADAAEVMTPRTEVHAVDVEDGLSEAMDTILECGHSRIPVFEDTIDAIIGTVTARRVMLEMAKEPGSRAALSTLLDPPMLVPETKPVAQLLAEFRDVRQKLAVVLDEYGGTAGIVTMSDVVGEIVGDFLEEHEPDEEHIKEVDRGLFEISAGLHVSEVNEALALEIPEEEDFETLGGFVLARLGHIPQQGESFVWQNAQYAVQEASDRRVISVRVRLSA